MNTNIDLRQLAVHRGPKAESAAPRVRIVTRYLLPFGLLAGFVLLLGWAFRDSFWPGQRVTVMPVIVQQAEVQRARTPLFKAAGWIEPRPTPIRVAALASGVIEELLVVEDDELQAGQPIAILIKADAELSLAAAEAVEKLRKAEVDQARAALQAAKTNFEQPVQLEAAAAEANVELARIQTTLTNLPFEIEQAQARLRIAQADLQAREKAGDAVPLVEIQRTRGQVDAAAARVQLLQAQRETLAREQAALAARCAALSTRLELKSDEIKALGEAEAALEAAAARLREAEVNVEQAKLRCERMTIRAPVAGRVFHLHAYPGTQVVAGMTQGARMDPSTVISLYQPDRLQVRVDVRYEDLPRVRRGQPVQIHTPAVASPIQGTVLFLSSLADIQKNTLEVKVGIDTPPALLKPEMLVDVTFLSADEPEGDTPRQQLRLLIPRQLVQKGDAGAYVWVADVLSRYARRQPVATGAATAEGLIEIVDGLTPGSRLIVDGREQLRDGDRIVIAGEDQSLGLENSGVTH